MKKIIVLLLAVSIVLCGCSKESESSVLNKLNKKINDNKSYYMSGDLELRNNDEVYKYDVEVSFKAKSFYKVSLKNKSNDSLQVILKNKDGVYILTPALNRSFKFQSDWPYNNSQIYLLKAILDDIKNDKKHEFINNKNNYTFKCSVNYPNNKELVREDVVFNKNLKLKSVKVFDKEDILSMEFKVKKLDYSPSFDDDYFDINSVMESSNMNESTKEVSSIEESIYPLILPTNTKLISEEKINKTNGNRILMTFDGDSPFLLVEETANINDELTVIPTNGTPYQLMDTLGVMTNNSLTWTSNGIEYYLVSDVLSQDEMVSIAESIYVLPTMK